MTAATAAEKPLAKNKERKAEKAIDKKGMSGATLKRLTTNMTSGENTGKFVLGIILRLVADIRVRSANDDAAGVDGD